MKKYLKISGTSNKSGVSQQKVPAKKGVKRKYKEDYVNFGFAASGSDDHQLPCALFAILPCQMRPSFFACSADT